MEKKPLVVLTGPTASGKTELSLELAKQIGGEIISADSIQAYKYMDIGSAKITREQMRGIPHYLIDEIEPEEEFNVVVFKNLARKYMEEIYSRNKIPIIAGGTGFYIQAILYDVDFTQTETDTSLRRELESLLEEKGPEYLHDRLQKVDEEAARQIHINNSKKVIRALEFYHQTGSKISLHNKEQRENTSPYNFAYFVLNLDREVLYERINLRIDNMLKDGLTAEVRGLKEKGYSKDLVSMQGLGYKEIYRYLEGEISLEEAVYLLKRDTRHFAKRQLTWFRREKEVDWVEYEKFHQDKSLMLEYMLKVLKNKEII